MVLNSTSDCDKLEYCLVQQEMKSQNKISQGRRQNLNGGLDMTSIQERLAHHVMEYFKAFDLKSQDEENLRQVLRREVKILLEQGQIVDVSLSS